MRKPALLVLFLAFAAPLAHADPISGVSASYNVDVGPMTMMAVRFSFDVSKDTVNSQATIKSKGLSKIFSEYSATVEGEGRIDGADFQPAVFKMAREKDDRKRRTTVIWQDGGTISMDPPAHKKAEVQAKVEKALSPGVADPITAILRVGAAGDNPCTSVQRVFDGRDVFELAFQDLGKGELNGKYGFNGAVRKCEVRWHPIAGRSFERGDPDDVYGVAFAPMGTLSTGQMLWFPVLMTGTVKGLSFEAYVTKLEAHGAGGESQTPTQN